MSTDDGTRPYLVRGTGLLHAAICAALPPSPVRASEVDGDADRREAAAVIAVDDGWDQSRHHQVHRDCEADGVPWLPVWTELGVAVVGPLHRPGESGCVSCLALRRDGARLRFEDHDRALDRHRDTVQTTPSAWLTAAAAQVVAIVVRDVRDRNGLLGPDRYVTVDLRTLAVDVHRFLPDPLCPLCGVLPEDSPALAAIELAPRPKLAPDVHRTRDIGNELDTLLRTYVSADAGLIRSLNRTADGGLVVAVAEMRLRGTTNVEAGYGRSRSYRNSEMTAVLEALERYGGVAPGGKRTAVTGSYADLGDDALDPRRCGVHDPAAYASPGFPFRPFTEDSVCRWVWGHSFARNAPILVPEPVAYYRTHRHTEVDRPFFYEISNGCALGSCLEEAILYGILEVAERDAFLLTWYGRLPVPRFDLTTAADHAIPIQAAAISRETGYDVTVLDITMEHGIPCAWAVALNDDPDKPRILCAAGSHLTPERAVLNALSELGPIVTNEVRRWPRERERAAAMAGDPDLVRSMPDHSVVSAAHEVFPRFGFLFESGATTSLVPDDTFGHDDLSDDLRVVLRRYLDRGLDVVVVDQTTPEHRAGGLACVKVLIPGLVPMTFGHRLRRLVGLPRVRTVPALLGYRSGPLPAADVNPHPHPFP